MVELQLVKSCHGAKADHRERRKDWGTTLVAGVVEDAPRQRFRNAAVAWGPDGRVDADVLFLALVGLIASWAMQRVDPARWSPRSTKPAFG